MMKLRIEPITLDLKTTFRVAHGASDQRFNVLVHLDEGIGEAPAVFYYGETRQSIVAYLEALPDLGDDLYDMDSVLRRLPPGSRAARAAVDIALHDLWGKRLGQPLYRLFGLNPAHLPLTSFTVAMDEPALMAERVREGGYPIIKIKLGSKHDEKIVAAIRNVSDARLRVDANAGWTRTQALELIPRLASYDLEMVEQPLAADDIEGLRWLRQELRSRDVNVPIFADESAQDSRSVARLAGAVDGVVIKLMKTCGLRDALRAIHVARAHEMQIMLSCMVETSVGVTAAAHLAPLCDYVDLDGPLLIKNDPYLGLRYEGAALSLPDGPGIGLVRR
jgi:L-Ala-D/L-Glu epimerase